jgi:hypothetical protein
MKFTRSGSVCFIAGTVAGVGVVIAACGGQDATDLSSTAFDGGTEAGSDGATSSSSSSSGGTGSDGGGGGADASADAAAGAKNTGDACKTDDECKSGKCWMKEYCTVACTKKNDTDPACQALGGSFSGTCSKQGFCEKK